MRNSTYMLPIVVLSLQMGSSAETALQKYTSMRGRINQNMSATDFYTPWRAERTTALPGMKDTGNGIPDLAAREITNGCDQMTRNVNRNIFTTNLTGGSAHFSDPDSINHNNKYYRRNMP